MSEMTSRGKQGPKRSRRLMQLGAKKPKQPAKVATFRRPRTDWPDPHGADPPAANISKKPKKPKKVALAGHLQGGVKADKHRTFGWRRRSGAESKAAALPEPVRCHRGPLTGWSE